MNTIEVLTKARDLISNKDNWCKDVLFQTRRDGPTRHCVMGAINLVIDKTPRHTFLSPANREAIEVLDEVCIRLFGDEKLAGVISGELPVRDHSCPAVAVNNKLGHDAIILALDTAIGDYPDHAPKEETCERRLANRV